MTARQRRNYMGYTRIQTESGWYRKINKNRQMALYFSVFCAVIAGILFLGGLV